MKKIFLLFCTLSVWSIGFSQIATTSDDVTIDPDTLFLNDVYTGSIYLLNNTSQPINIAAIQQYCTNCTGGWTWNVSYMSFSLPHYLYPGQTELIQIIVDVLAMGDPDITYLPSTMAITTTIGVQYCHILLDDDLIQSVNENNPVKFSLYPNPTIDNITIETCSSGRLSIQCLNGQELLNQSITEPKTVIDVSHLPKGIYIIKLTGEKSVQVGKLIKN